ncbi:MAG: Nudix family hydrolase, partial [Acidiferrobacterales bacterium]
MTTSESTPNTAAKSALHVVAAVISHGEDILVAKRSRASHQGGKWEFPGGKVRATESARDALARELYEELGITVEAAYPLIQVRHTYPDKTVFLDVWCVTDFQGKPHGREGQHVSWVKAEQLNALDFPNANHPIVQAARLPALYAISDCSRIGEHRFLEKLERGLAAGIRLLQLREPHLGTEAYQTLARRVVQLCHRWGAKVLLNCEPEWVQACKADGVHLNSQRLRALHTRPLSRDYWVAASTHNA